jgi:hypothetical protein
MSQNRFAIEERIGMLRAAGVIVSAADEKRIRDSITGSLTALNAAVKGSLFGTEPQHFDRVLREAAPTVKK